MLANVALGFRPVVTTLFVGIGLIFAFFVVWIGLTMLDSVRKGGGGRW